MVLADLDYLNGICSLITVFFSFLVGISILFRYAKLRKKVLLYVGLVAIGTSEPWWPHSIGFIKCVMTGSGLTPQLYFLLGNVLVPVSLLLWLMAFNNLKFQGRQKVIPIFGLVYCVIFEVVFFTLLLSDPTASMVGVLIGDVDVQYSPTMLVLLIIALGTILSTGLIFGFESLKTDSIEIQLKGKLLIVAFIFYCSGAAIDSLILSNPLNLTVSRLLVTFSALCFYGGFMLPRWMKELLVKED